MFEYTIMYAKIKFHLSSSQDRHLNQFICYPKHLIRFGKIVDN